jgi:hypothetical protein
VFGHDVVGVGIDESTGTARVTVENEEVGEAVQAEFGDKVSIALGSKLNAIACTSYSSCTPWRGGIKITSQGGSVFCSYGFNASWNNNGALKFITAGHCLDTTWKHDGDNIGATGKNCFVGTSCVHDTQRVANADTYGGPRYCTIGSVFSACYTLSAGSKLYSSVADNDTANAQGYTSGWDPALNINEADYYYLLEDGNGLFYGYVLEHARFGGDSGGPSTWNNKIYGTASGSDEQTTNCSLSRCYTTFAYASIAETIHNVTVCTTSAC